jgi:hypothetical protein
MTDINRFIDDGNVIFVADTVHAHQRMLAVYGTTIKKFALNERQAIVDFLLWAIHENFGLPEDLKLA